MQTEVNQPVEQPLTTAPSPRKTGGWSTIAVLLAFLLGWGATFALVQLRQQRSPADAVAAKSREIAEKAKDLAAAAKERLAEATAPAKTEPVKTTEPVPAETPVATTPFPAEPAPVTVAPKDDVPSYLQEREMVRKLMEENVETVKILSR
ncbi:MAG: hypothetical protein ABSD58_13850 [Verrucomicrobiia bacterium]|jgi:uncharacterized protein HemX